MIVELANTISSRDEDIERSTYQSTLFPQPATEREIHQSPRGSKWWMETYVSHGSIGGNSIHILSIPRRCRLERTTPLCRCAAMRGRYCNFSMDQAERANVEYFPVTGHLTANLSISRQACQRWVTDDLTCSCCSPLLVGFLKLSKARNLLVLVNKTYQELPGHPQWMLRRLEGRIFNKERI
jgi:hypothetical protein